MQGLQKSKRVSWASDGSLCQVRLFLSEESPSQVGVGGQDHLQAKTNLSGFSVNGLVPDDNLPPGFEGFNPSNQSKNNLVQIPVVNWRPPPKFILNVEWQVASGDESKEVEIQNQRELRVLEAYYPRQSAIPPDPTIAPDAEVPVQDDRTLPLVPITPIEDDDIAIDPLSNSSGPASASLGSSPLGAQLTFPSSQNLFSSHNGGTSSSGVPSSIQEDTLKAALTAVTKSNDQIDRDLLVKILSNPTILEQLVRPQGTGPGLGPGPDPQAIPKPPISPGPPGYPLDLGSSASEMILNTVSYPFPNGSVPLTYPQPVPPLHGVVPQVGPVVQPGPTSHPVKDLSYLKNLVQQHGEERQPELHGSYLTHQIHHQGIIVDQDVDNNSKPRDGKPKIMKPCLFYNSSKGCRHGANCVYQHDMSNQQRVSIIPEMQGAKRLKMDREIKRSQSYS